MSRTPEKGTALAPAVLAGLLSGDQRFPQASLARKEWPSESGKWQMARTLSGNSFWHVKWRRQCDPQENSSVRNVWNIV